MPIGGDGGGNGVGRIRINTADGTVEEGASALVTPLASEVSIWLR